MTLLAAIGGSGYTDNASINANPNWSTLLSSQTTVPQNYLAASPAGERWFVGQYGNVGYHSLLNTPNPDELEVSFGVRHHGFLTGSSAWCTILVDNDAGGDNILMKVSPNFNNIGIKLAPYDDNTPEETTGFVGSKSISQDTTYYITLRVRFDNGTGNGRMQLWKNQTKVWERSGLAMSEITKVDVDNVRIELGANGPPVGSYFSTINTTAHDVWQGVDDDSPSPVLKVLDDTVNYIPAASEVDITYYIGPWVPVITQALPFSFIRSSSPGIVT